MGEGQCSLLSGLFPGDATVEVNCERVKYAPVEKVVEAIPRVPSDSSEMWRGDMKRRGRKQGE